MKKEVISLSITTMALLYEVEMVEKGKFVFLKLEDAGKEISVSQSKIDKFWQQIESIGVWDWKKKYECGKNEPEPLPDGVSWTLQLRSPDGKVKYATGYEKYPDTFNNLVEIFDELLGNKYDPDNKFFNYDKEEEK